VIWLVKLRLKLGVATRLLVVARHPVALPLADNEDRGLDVELKDGVLEWRPVVVRHQELDELRVTLGPLRRLLGCLAGRNPGGADDLHIGRHVID